MKQTEQIVPMKQFNLVGARELRANKIGMVLIAVTLVLGFVIAYQVKLMNGMQNTIRALEDNRVMYGYPNSEGIFISSKRIPDQHIKGFVSVFTENYFNYTPESTVTNANEALRMMSTRLRSLQEERMRTTSKAAYEQQITQVFNRTSDYTIEILKDRGYLVTFPAKRHRVVMGSVFKIEEYIVKLLLRPVKPSKHFEWAIVVDDYQIEEKK
jgi:hypothetical protein